MNMIGNISESDLLYEVHRFGSHRIWMVRRDLARAGVHPHVDAALILGIGSRETNLQNEVGDGGHGRGLLQIDDRMNPDVLRRSHGCRNLSYIPVYPDSLRAGRVPTLKAQIRYGVAELEGSVLFARNNGVHVGHRLKFAVSAWNGGRGGALQGYDNHGDSDKWTTGGDYAADVLARADYIRRHILNERP